MTAEPSLPHQLLQLSYTVQARLERSVCSGRVAYLVCFSSTGFTLLAATSSNGLVSLTK
jgi:hypothetical protein